MRHYSAVEYLLAGAGVLLLALVLFWMIDTVGTDVAGTVDGHIAAVDYHPAWTQIDTNKNGTTIIHHPESWSITVEGGGMLLSGTFSHPDEPGRPARFTYGIGRLSGSPHLKSIH